MKKIIYLFIFCLFVCWIYTYQVSYEAIRQRDWKKRGGASLIFRDAIVFEPHYKTSFFLQENGAIYQKDQYLGRIIKKHHNYLNMYITVMDLNNQTIMYIAKF